MANNIFNVPNWAVSTAYRKNDFFLKNGLVYYALINHISTSNFNNDVTNGKVGGYILNNGENKPFFLWKSAYNPTTENEPKINKISLGDGYTIRTNNNINNLLEVINLEFESDLDEATAILKFLKDRNGTESFIYIPAAPRGIISRWICPRWNDAYPFFNNYKINAVFERSVV